jgi:hypothetical protein
LRDRNLSEALVRLHQGSALPDCSWGTNPGQEWTLYARHAELARMLADISVLRARWGFENGQWDDGINDVIATMMLSRHIGRDPHSVGLHHGVQIESISIRAAGAYLPQMPRAARDQLAAKLDALPRVTTMTELFNHYASSVDWVVTELRQAETEGRFPERLQTMFGLPSDEAHAILQRVRSAEGLRKLAPDARRLLHEAGEAMALGVEEFRGKARPRLESAFKDNPLAELISTGLDYEYDEQAVGRCRFAMLKAAIDVVANGQSALSRHPDPYGSAFRYSPFPGGFELRSDFTRDGKNLGSEPFGLREK